MKVIFWVVVLFVPLLSACQPVTQNTGPSTQSPQAEAPTVFLAPIEPTEQQYPDVITATLTHKGENLFDVAVTVSSPYDTPQRYADAWRLIAPDGTTLGERILLHDHASEQPFTRTLNDVKIPSDVFTVTVEGRDQQYGYGGKTVVIAVPR